MKLAIFYDNGERKFVDISEIETATIKDFLDAGFSNEDSGLRYEKVNDNGEELFSGFNFEGLKTIKEIENEGIDTDWHKIEYWDGNNWQTEVFEDYETGEFEIEKLEDPNPAYYFNYLLKNMEDKEEIKCTRSNISGSLSPYYKEEL